MDKGIEKIAAEFEKREGKIKHLQSRYVVLYSNLIPYCDPEELMIYIALKLHAITNSVAWPGLETLRSLLTDGDGNYWSRDRIIRTLLRMEERCRLKIRRVHGRGNTYDITFYDHVNQSRNATGTSRKTRRPPVAERDPNSNVVKSNKSNTIAAGAADGDFKVNEYVDSMIENDQEHISVIGMYADELLKARRLRMWRTRAEAQSFISRNLKIAKILVPYSAPQIRATVKYLINKKIQGRQIDFSLETVGKWIDKPEVYG